MHTEHSRIVEKECCRAYEKCPSERGWYVPRFHIALWHNELGESVGLKNYCTSEK